MTKRRALADHDVELEFLQRRIQHLLDDRAEPVDLVDEQHVVGFEVGQDRREIAGAFEHGTRSLAEVDPHLVRDDVGQRRLAESRRPEDQHMVERLAAAPGGLDEDAHLLLDARLADVLVQGFWPYRTVERPVLGTGFGARDAIVFDACHGVNAPPAAVHAG